VGWNCLPGKDSRGVVGGTTDRWMRVDVQQLRSTATAGQTHPRHFLR
jgi:hypothetical protein